MTIKIKANMESVEQFSKLLAKKKKKLPEAMGHAIKRTAAHGRTNIIGQIKDGTYIKDGIIRERAKFERSGKMFAVVELNPSGRLGTRHFKGEQNENGVTFQIGPGEKLLLSRSAFMGPKLGKKNKKWKGNAFRRVGPNRKPIIKVLGVSPWGFFTKRNLVGPTQEHLQEWLTKRLVHELKRLFGLLGG